MTNSYSHIITDVNHPVAELKLNRPAVHNALNIEMIREISEALDMFNTMDDLRIIHISAEGSNFSAGADLHWMKQGINQSEEQLRAESLELAMLFNKIMNSKHVVILSAKGKVIGGAVGMTAAADIVVADPETTFMFSEVKLGLIPATIAPYVYSKTGMKAKEWMLTGRSITAMEALQGGLVHVVAEKDTLAPTTDKVIKRTLGGGPEALRGIKDLFSSGILEKNPDETMEQTSALIARFRTSDEGQEGIKSFFEKRKPRWINENA